VRQLVFVDFRMLWVASMSRHSVRTARRPRLRNRPIPRFDFVCANTGSIIRWPSWREESRMSVPLGDVCFLDSVHDQVAAASFPRWRWPIRTV
jgi:hypothetical protein